MTINHTQNSPERVQRIGVIAQDPFVRHWMAQLIMRDWRTQVIDSTASIETLAGLAADLSTHKLDAIVLDADDLPADFSSFMGTIKGEKLSPRLIVLSTQLIPAVIDHLNDEPLGGYLIKGEVEVSLAWAVIEAIQGVLVISKSVEQKLIDENRLPNRACIVFNGIEASEFLTAAENRNAYMAFVLSMSRGNLADELMMSPGSSWTLISKLYHCLGVNDLLNGDDWIQFHAECDPILLARIAQLKGEQPEFKRALSEETFAFHVYTKPTKNQYGR